MTIVEDIKTGHQSLVDSGAVAGTLGHLLMWSVRDLSIHHDTLSNVLQRNNLGKSTPKEPADSDVFRRVTNNIKQKREPQSDGTYLNVLVRDVSTNPEAILRRVVVEQVDPTGKRLTYTEAYDVSLDKETSYMEVNQLPTHQPSGVDAVMDGLVSVFHATRNHLDGNAIRTVIKRSLDANYAIPIRETGGVVFLPKPLDSVGIDLEGMASEIDGVSVHTVPIPDVAKQSDMISGAATASIVRDVDELITEIAEAKRSDSLTDRKVAKFSETHKGLKKKISKYNELLNTSLEETLTRLQVLDQSIVSVVG